MQEARCEIAGGPSPLAAELAQCLEGAALALPYLINADAVPDARAITARCRAFADRPTERKGALIVTILSPAPPAADCAEDLQEAAALWAFTRWAALHWAPRGIRVNAIGLGISPCSPSEPQEQAGRAAFPSHAAAATMEDIARTIQAMAAWPSMTGQIIRLGV